jgi:hypothetical protein
MQMNLEFASMLRWSKKHAKLFDWNSRRQAWKRYTSGDLKSIWWMREARQSESKKKKENCITLRRSFWRMITKKMDRIKFARSRRFATFNQSFVQILFLI